MSSVSETISVGGPAPGILARERTFAGPNFNRWLIPPCALAIHLCIGMAYGFSVFWLPMTRQLTNTDAAVCAKLSLLGALTTTTCNWTVPEVTHIFETFIAVLGISAFIWGGWLEHAGPRKAGFIAAWCWGGGLIVGGIGVIVHQLWLLYLGCGVLGGVGQGLGYITPVSTLIKWFPDRRGMATGLAIMGYGGGAMIGAPLAVAMMAHFAPSGTLGVAQALIGLGIIYFIAMSAGAFGFRISPPGWKPEGWTEPEPGARGGMITHKHVHLELAWKLPQFWLIWFVLFLNVTAGIAVISMASPMFQDIFGAKLLGESGAVALTAAHKAMIVAAAAGLVGLISLFNSLGRIFWASLSDMIGRKNTYYAFFVIGIALYLTLPTLGHHGLAGLFVAAVCVILTMYGGGFSTVPAYLADVFGTQMVGAIHGRLLTAWSAAGIVGPLVIAALREAQLNAGVAHNLVYDRTLYLMAGLLLVGLVCNAMVKPIKDEHFMDEEQLAHERELQHETRSVGHGEAAARGPFGVTGILAWLGVGIPFLIGLFIAVQKASALF